MKRRDFTNILFATALLGKVGFTKEITSKVNLPSILSDYPLCKEHCPNVCAYIRCLKDEVPGGYLKDLPSCNTVTEYFHKALEHAEVLKKNFTFIKHPCDQIALLHTTKDYLWNKHRGPLADHEGKFLIAKFKKINDIWQLV